MTLGKLHNLLILSFYLKMDIIRFQHVVERINRENVFNSLITQQVFILMFIILFESKRKQFFYMNDLENKVSFKKPKLSLSRLRS